MTEQPPPSHLPAKDNVVPDASEVPDYDAIEAQWESALASASASADGFQRARDEAGLSTPSSVVGSAEGTAHFEGLRINGNGVLDEVHTESLRSRPLDLSALDGVKDKVRADQEPVTDDGNGPRRQSS